MTRAEKAKEYFMQGYACSQAVAMAFASDVGIDKDVAGKMTLPFGGGFGRLRLTCGAVSGMLAVYGLTATQIPTTLENKKLVYEGTRELISRFEKANGSSVCAELLKTADKRPCAEIVYTAAQILEEYLKEIGKLN